MHARKYPDTARRVFLCLFFVACGLTAAGAENRGEKTYVGSQACQACHEKEFESFQAHAKKAKSFSSVQIMKKGLTTSELQSCYACHTTGYGEPGGFRSEAETPHLKNAGCEVCHGPGSLHAQTEDPDNIKGALSVADCERCHSHDRVTAFRYKPLIHGGAH